jgi:hypothetical protein
MRDELRKLCIAGCGAAVAELRAAGSQRVTLDEIRTHLLMTICTFPDGIAVLASDAGYPTNHEETEDGEPVFAAR